jgi:hypothetical protein
MPARFRDLVARKHRALGRGTLCGVIGADGGGGVIVAGVIGAGGGGGVIVAGVIGAGGGGGNGGNLVGGGSASLGGLAAGNIRGIVVTSPGRVVGPGIVRGGGVRSLAPDCIGGIAVTGTV